MIYATIKYMSKTIDDKVIPLWLYHPYPLYVLEYNIDNICVAYIYNNKIISIYWFDKNCIEISL